MTSINDDPVIASLQRQIQERRAVVQALRKERDQLNQKAQQLVHEAEEYDRLYNEIMQKHDWSKGTATRNGFRSPSTVIAQCRKAVEQPAGQDTPQRPAHEPETPPVADAGAPVAAGGGGAFQGPTETGI